MFVYRSNLYRQYVGRDAMKERMSQRQGANTSETTKGMLEKFYTTVSTAAQPRANRYSSLREKRAAAKAQGSLHCLLTLALHNPSFPLKQKKEIRGSLGVLLIGRAPLKSQDTSSTEPL